VPNLLVHNITQNGEKRRTSQKANEAPNAKRPNQVSLTVKLTGVEREFRATNTEGGSKTHVDIKHQTLVIQIDPYLAARKQP